MTTNITPIEALEKIARSTQLSSIDLKHIAMEALEALAPQERRQYEYKSVYPDTPQECDVKQFNIDGVCTIKTKRHYGTIFGLKDTQMFYCDAYRDINSDDCKKCKQLHSQQKTFTVEEVKNIMYSVENKYFGERMVTIFIEYVIKEFEKAVE